MPEGHDGGTGSGDDLGSNKRRAETNDHKKKHKNFIDLWGGG